MSKYIDQEHVVKEIEDWADGFEDSPGYFSGKQVAAVIQNCVDIVLNAKTIEASDWIPIEDDLPKEDELVMVTMEKDGHRMTTTAVYYPSSLFWHDYVTAWMPYIEPYKGEDDECNN